MGKGSRRSARTIRRDPLAGDGFEEAGVDLLVDDPEQRRVTIADGIIDAADLAVLDLDESILRRVNVVGHDPLVLRLATVDLIDCDLANARIPKSRWDDVVVTGSRLTGIDLGESRVHRTRFERCALNYAGFRGANLERVRFSECDLRNVDFTGAVLVEVEFDHCELDGLVADDASIEHVDAQGSSLGATEVRHLRGMTISAHQAIEMVDRLASRLGIIVAREPAPDDGSAIGGAASGPEDDEAFESEEPRR